MVKYQTRRLDRVYSALSDATRRLIFEQLATQEMSVSELAAPFEVSLPAISRHLRVLEAAGLLAREKQGRIIRCRRLAAPLQSAGEWIVSYRTFWESRFDALERYLREERKEEARRVETGSRYRKISVRRQDHRAESRSPSRLVTLDSTFSALADATRRKILGRLRSGALAVTELAEPFPVSLPAISKHLRVLENAGLLRREKEGRVQFCRLIANPLQEAADWIARHARS